MPKHQHRKLSRKKPYSYKASSTTVKRSVKRAAIALAEGRCSAAASAIKSAVAAVGKSTRSRRKAAGGKVVRLKFKRAVAMYGAVCGRLHLSGK